MHKVEDYISASEKSNFFILKEYEHSNVIFNEGEQCTGISFVISGQVLIVTSTYNEKEEIINVINEGEMFGDVLCFSTNPSYLGNVIAKKKTKILYLPIENFYELIKVNSSFLPFILNEISDKTLIIKNQTKLLCHKNIKDRIIYYLNNESKKHKTKEINISSVEKLSNILSLPRPSVSRELSKLECEGLIEKKKNTIKILF